MCRCQRSGCDEDGTLALKIVVPSASGLRPTAAEGLLGVIMCPAHFEEAELQPEFLMHPAIQMLFNRVLDDDAAPDWDEAYLTSVPIESAEFKAWRAQEMVLH